MVSRFAGVPTEGDGAATGQGRVSAMWGGRAFVQACRNVLEQSIVGVLQTDTDGTLTFVNQRLCDMLGYTEEQLLGRRLDGVAGTGSIDTVQAALAQLAAGASGRMFDGHYQRSDGSPVLATTSATALRKGSRFDGVIAVVLDITERRQTERALRRSERRYRTLFESIDEAFCLVRVLFDADGNAVDARYLETNPAFGRQTGHDNVQGRTLRELVPDIEPVWFEIYGRIARGGEPVRFIRQSKSLEDRWFDIYAFRPEDGEEDTVAVLFNDITAQKQAEQALRESETRFRTMANASPSILWSAFADGTPTFVSELWYEYTGLAPGADLAHEWTEVIHPDDVVLAQAAWHDVALGGSTYEVEVRLRRHDGVYRWFLMRAMPLRADDGTIVSWFGSSTDIHDRRQAEEALRLSEQRASLAMDVARLGTWSCDLRTGVMSADARSREICGFDLEIPLDLATVATRVHPEDRQRAEAALRSALMLESDGRYAEEFRWVHPDGTVRWALARGQVLFRGLGDQRRGVLVLGSLFDITERRGTEEALRDLDRRKDEFLATLSHELRNPLAPLRNCLHLLHMEVGGELDRQKLLTIMDHQVTHLTRLVDDLLEVSRVTHGKIPLKIELVELAEVCTRAVEGSRPAIELAHHTLTVDLPEQPLRLEADPVRLAQVLGNLLNNAAKYTDPGGHILLSGRREGEEIVLRVRDDGLGIAQEQLPHVFDLFVQADRSLTHSQGGLGIGLTLVRSLVELHGGSVRARSAGIGHGSEFEVRLPIHHAQAADARGGGEPRRAAEARHRILVVDDNHEHADTLALFLEISGNDVRTAYDGLEAVEAAADFHPDAVLLDIGMPGVDGYEACRRIRALPDGEATVVVALTGWGQEEDRRRSHEAQFDAHMVKPADPAALLALVESLQPRQPGGATLGVR
jgi:PAS domain S-box-containing protein